MSVEYELWLQSPEGERLRPLDQWSKLDYGRSLGGPIGHFTLTLPNTGRLRDEIRNGSRVEIWRGRDRLKVDTDTLWFVDRIEQRIERGVETLRISGVSAVDILRRRIVAYPADVFETNKSSMTASTMMWQAVREQYVGLSSDPDSHGTFDSERARGDLTLALPLTITAPETAKRFAHRNLYNVCLELMEESLAEIWPTFFDVVWTGDRTLQFQTYVPDRGKHRIPGSLTADPLVFSTALGNLDEPRLIHDHSEEATVVYAGGQGEGADRLVGVARARARERDHPWARVEVWRDATQYTQLSSLEAEARSELERRRPRIIVDGKLLDAPGSRYGEDWGYGDRCIIEAFGHQIQAWIWGVQITAEASREEIRGIFREVPTPV